MTLSQLDQLTSPGCDRRAFICFAALATLGCDARATESDAAPGLLVSHFRRALLSDYEVLAAAFDAWAKVGGTLQLERAHIYQLGARAKHKDWFVLDNVENAVLDGNGATFKVHSAPGSASSILRLSNCRNVRVRNLAAMDTGFRNEQSGARFLALSAGSRSSGPFVFENLKGFRLLTFLHADGPAAPHRVEGISLEKNCAALQCYYAINFQDQGDGLRGQLTATNCRRAYFPYGVSNHNLSIAVHHDGLSVAPSAESAVLIKSYGRPTRNMRLRVAFSGVLAWVAVNEKLTPGSCVTLEHQSQSGQPGVIENVSVFIDIASGTSDPFSVHRFTMRSYSAAGIPEVRTNNIWRNIHIGGNLRPGRAAAITLASVPREPVTLVLADQALQASTRMPIAGVKLTIRGQPKP